MIGSKKHTGRVVCLAAVGVLMLASGACAAPPKAPYVPQETRVVLLPIVGGKGIADETLGSARISLGRQFVGHGFKVVPAAAAAAALDSVKLTLTPQAPPTPEALTKIGAATNARLVVFVAVAPAGVKVWVWDTKTRAFAADGSGGAGTAQAAVKAALAGFFKPYAAYDC